jgi:tetratricopeptide (TPR) repeat protein
VGAKRWGTKVRRGPGGRGRRKNVILPVRLRYLAEPANISGRIGRSGYSDWPFSFTLILTHQLLTSRWAARLLVLLGLGAAGCASDKNLVSHAFNNVAARDNAYFLAREKLRGLEDKLYAGRINDYNQTLPLFPTLDSASVKANRPDLNEIIKKASMPIQHRPGSDWTDDAYILVGWSRFYQMQFDDAALTFKYVNSTSKDANAKHEALIGLMRTFVAQGELESAKAVSDLLDKEEGRPEDARQLFLTRADYYIRTDEPAKAIPQLEKAIPLIEYKNERSRTRYILAQLYQDAGENKKAYDQLDQILARNPPYELDFQAKLMMAQVSDLSTKDRARLDKNFAGLLKDLNNKDYRDKIYYEMARLNYREKNYPEALKLLRQSVQATTTNRFQKSYAYLLAGRIYYENLQKYRLAAAYYDSTVQTMGKEAKGYAAIKERSDILKEFAKQYTIVETQDSLQALARMAPDALTERLGTYADAELAARQREADRQAALAKVQARAADLASRTTSASSSLGSNLPGGAPAPDVTAFDPTATAAAGQWYFDNPTTLGTARADFIRKWGDRQLQDNWRTNRQASSSPNTIANGGAPLSVTGNSTTNVNGGRPDSVAKAADPAAARNNLVAQYRASLPTTPTQLEASDKQVEAALYELGGIYKEQLKEREKGFETYEKQVTRYQRGEHAPDAYYLLYLYYKDKPDAAKMAQYAAALQREFPKSIYAKLIADPLYREHELALHNAVASRVDSAFTMYKNQEFRKATAVLARTEKQYPKSDLTDRVAYLKTLLVVRTQPPLTARSSVEKFYKDYPESPLVPQAQALAESYKKQESGQLAGALASTEKPVVSLFRPGEVDNRIRIFYREDESPAKALGPAPTATPVAPRTTPTPLPGEKPASLVPGGSPGPEPQPLAAAAATAPEALAGTPAATPAPAAPVRKGRPTRKQLAEEAAAKKAAALAATSTNAPATAPGAAATTPPVAAGTTPAPVEAPGTASGAVPATVAPIRKGRPTRKQLADEAAAKKAAALAAGATGATPGTTPPATTTPAAATPTAGASAASSAPTTAYTTQLNGPHAVVLVFPKDSPAANGLVAQLTTYNGRFFKASNLTVEALTLGPEQELVRVLPLPGAKVAQSYATKLRGPQSPLAKLRGAGYQTLVISPENLTLLQNSGDLAGYLSFYQRVYK